MVLNIYTKSASNLTNRYLDMAPSDGKKEMSIFKGQFNSVVVDFTLTLKRYDLQHITAY